MRTVSPSPPEQPHIGTMKHKHYGRAATPTVILPYEPSAGRRPPISAQAAPWYPSPGSAVDRTLAAFGWIGIEGKRREIRAYLTTLEGKESGSVLAQFGQRSKKLSGRVSSSLL